MRPGTPRIQPQPLADVQPLKLFNKQRTVSGLYELTEDGVLGFFDEINKNQQIYGIKDNAVKQKFPDVVKRVRDITKGGVGPIFLSPGMVLPFLDITLEVKSLYDLVGWIFSVAAGKTDKAANRNNYYLPLICVYSLFCRRLTEKMKVPGKTTVLDHDPTMAQISWFENPDDGLTYFCMSANLDCRTESCREVYKGGKQDIQRQRGEQLKAIGALNKSVDVKVIPTGGANLYGMCAETVSFLFIKSIMNRKTKVDFKPDRVSGIAFEGFRILPESPGQVASPYRSDSVKATGGMREPCRTCQMLLTSPQLKFVLANFRDSF